MPAIGLAENGHDNGVRGVSPRKLHIGRDAVWRDTLQHELAGVSVFTFVALERNGSRWMRMRAVARRMRAKAIWVGVRRRTISLIRG